MGQKVNPNGIRLGIVKPWNSTWFANTQDFADNLDGDFKVRKFLTKELAAPTFNSRKQGPREPRRQLKVFV